MTLTEVGKPGVIVQRNGGICKREEWWGRRGGVWFRRQGGLYQLGEVGLPVVWCGVLIPRGWWE
jgi:hypothetical protein